MATLAGAAGVGASAHSMRMAAALTAWRRAARLGRALAALEKAHDRTRRLAESEERYRSLIEAQRDIIVQRDAPGRITFANARFAELMGDVPSRR